MPQLKCCGWASRLTRVDVPHLALYIATMLKRGPKHRRDGYAMMPGVLESTVAEAKEAIEQLGKAENIERARIDAKLAEVDAAKDKFRRSRR